MRRFSMSKVFSAIALVMACGATGVWAQGNKPATSQDLTLTAKDGADIKITYFKSQAGQDAPVVVMLHGKKSNRLVWKSYAEALQKVDFAVVTVDLRGHGESVVEGGSDKKPNSAPKARDYAAMIALDMEAVKKFLHEEHQKKELNMNKLAIVAADMSTPVAIAYTEIDWEKEPYDDAPTLALRTPRGQDVQALVLLSPEISAPGLAVTKSLNVLRNLGRPVLICVGSKNASDLAAAKKTYDQLSPKEPKEEELRYIFLEQYDTTFQGTNLIGKGYKVEQHMYNFLVKFAKEHKSEWRDRRSKLLD
jgi:pimeloyl-ACP methyl ester carboxylesterase